MNKIIKYAITIVLIALAVTSFILFEAMHLTLVPNDPIMDALLGRTIYHLAITVLFVWLLYLIGNAPYASFKDTNRKTLLWCLPCLLVALANFPISALIKGEVAITRVDLMWLYIIYVISIAVLEELVFRGVLLFLLFDLFRNQKMRYFLSALICSLIFALFHLTNLIGGANIGDVLLQMLYTFLLGAMFSVMVFKTNNVWLCVIVHAIFNFGGLLTDQASGIASGTMWDVTFWILTITCGILCAGHIIVSLINLERKHVS